MTNTQDAKEKVCLIDGSGYIFRAFFASPQMTNPEGLPVNAVYGFLNMFLSLTANIKCDYCLVLFDAKRQNFRNEFFPEYKATRPRTSARVETAVRPYPRSGRGSEPALAANGRV